MEKSIVKSADRVLRIFEVFAQVKRPMRLSELAEELDIPQSSTSLLIKTLVQRGYMDYSAQGRMIQPTMRLALLGSWLNNQFSNVGGIHDMLSEIASVCKDTVILGAEMGVQVQYIHVVQGTQPLRYDLEAGTSRYLVDANAGRVLLSLKDDKQVDLIITKTNALRKDQIIDRDVVHKQIENIRVQGYSFVQDLVIPGASIIATPLDQGKVQNPLSMGIAGPTQRLQQNLEQNIALLKQAKIKYTT